jgi:hypothetical protein
MPVIGATSFVCATITLRASMMVLSLLNYWSMVYRTVRDVGVYRIVYYPNHAGDNMVSVPSSSDFSECKRGLLAGSWLIFHLIRIAW